jgi:hypothetical protein
MIYAIWEHDSHGSYDSYCFKGFFNSMYQARMYYRKMKKIFLKSNPDSWVLAFGAYNFDPRLDANGTLSNMAIKDFTVIESTDE